MLDDALSVLHASARVVLTVILWGRSQYYSHFIEEVRSHTWQRSGWSSSPLFSSSKYMLQSVHRGTFCNFLCKEIFICS